jgi:hypothetical protein
MWPSMQPGLRVAWGRKLIIFKLFIPMPKCFGDGGPLS